MNQLLCTLLSFSLALLLSTGFSQSVPLDPYFNYCTPTPVKEGFNIDKVQIGSWNSQSLISSTPQQTVKASVFGGVEQNYFFNLQGLAQTRDTFYWQIWINQNRDDKFDDPGELLLNTFTTRKQVATGKIRLPENFSGRRLVRVMLSRSKPNNPCGTKSKVLDYFDFWLEGNCPNPNPAEELKVAKVFEEQILLHFKWSKSTRFVYRLAEKGKVNYLETHAFGDTLLLKNLKYSDHYTFQYRLRCADGSNPEWSDTIWLETKYKSTCSTIDPDQLKIDSIGADHVVIRVLPQFNSVQYEYNLYSTQGAGDTVKGIASYGQLKIPLQLYGSRYFFGGIRKICKDSTYGSWRDGYQSFTTLSDPCDKVSLFINKTISGFSAHAFPSGKMAYEWRWRKKGATDWDTKQSDKDILALDFLDSTLVYELQARVMCKANSWSEWTATQTILMLKECPKPKLSDIEYKQYGTYFGLAYSGNLYEKVIWDYPPVPEGCSSIGDSVLKATFIWVKYGQRNYIRMRGVCSSIEPKSAYSDTLWFDNPCTAPDTSLFGIEQITEKSMVFAVRGPHCYYNNGVYLMITKDSLLPNEEWKTFLWSENNWGRFTDLTPGTKYFVKVKRQCFDRDSQFLYSPIKSFVTLDKPIVCNPVESKNVSITFEEPASIVIRIKPQEGHSIYKVLLTRFDDYVGTFYPEEFKDTVFRLKNIPQDAKYGITIARYCGPQTVLGELIPFTPPLSKCHKLNAAKMRAIQGIGDTTVAYYFNATYNHAPYIWRYREAGTSLWQDSIVSRTEVVEFVLPKQGLKYEIQVKPLSTIDCAQNWSDSIVYFFKCFNPYLIGRKVSENQVELTCNKMNTEYHWFYKLQGTEVWTAVSTGINNSLILNNLKPNSSYDLKIQTDCGGLGRSDFFQSTFSTKLCFYDSLKISHDYIYPNQVLLKTNLPQEDILSGRYQFNWSMVSPFKSSGRTPSKDTCRFSISGHHQFTLQLSCDNLNPEDHKVYNYQVQLLPCVVPSTNDIVVHEISSQAIKASVYRNKALQVAQIAYRKVGTQNLMMIKLSSNSEIGTLPNLEPNTTYELFARILCDPQSEGYSSWSPVKKVTTRKYGLVGDFLATVENNQANPVQQLRLIPNPSQGLFNLELPKTIEGLAELSIVNFNGQRIYNAQVQISQGATFPLDLSQHPQGVYLVHVRVGNQLYQEKLVLIK